MDQLSPLTHDLVIKALRAAKHRSLEPDGIRDAIWALVAPYCAGAFLRAYEQVEAGGPIPHELSGSLAFYPPKKIVIPPEHGNLINIADTRPIVMKNADAKVFR